MLVNDYSSKVNNMGKREKQLDFDVFLGRPILDVLVPIKRKKTGEWFVVKKRKKNENRI